ncbi:MAG: zf-HC2 domain-containing protein, partial [Phycisphaerales bacterium]|nr:zf-HC2 domain-containing protein [Phycisphaerales bacterium]
MMAMDCSTFETLLADAIGGELDETARTAFEAHAEHCAACGAEYRSLERTLTSVREHVGAPSAGVIRRAESAPRPSTPVWTAVRF